MRNPAEKEPRSARPDSLREEIQSLELPINAHIEALSYISLRQPIPQEVIAAVVQRATRNRNGLRFDLYSWNSICEQDYSSRIMEARAKLSFGTMLDSIVESYGDGSIAHATLRKTLIIKALEEKGVSISALISKSESKKRAIKW